MGLSLSQLADRAEHVADTSGGSAGDIDPHSPSAVWNVILEPVHERD